MALPERIWVCPDCHAQFVEGWRLKRHLMLTHGLSEKRAWDVTDRSEYHLRLRRVTYVEDLDAETGPSAKPDGRRRPGKRV